MSYCQARADARVPDGKGSTHREAHGACHTICCDDARTPSFLTCIPADSTTASNPTVRRWHVGHVHACTHANMHPFIHCLSIYQSIAVSQSLAQDNHDCGSLSLLVIRARRQYPDCSRRSPAHAHARAQVVPAHRRLLAAYGGCVAVLDMYSVRLVEDKCVLPSVLLH